jgi:transcription antitermination protein NusB
MMKVPYSRRAAREAALQVLYAVEVGNQTIDDVKDDETIFEEVEQQAQGFARQLAHRTLRNLREIDAVIDRFATDYPTERQTAVDRNILRLATAEILFAASDAPPGAVVNEAVELAKKYSADEAPRFVNGVLGTLLREVDAQRLPSSPAAADTADATADTVADTAPTTEETDV